MLRNQIKTALIANITYRAKGQAAGLNKHALKS